MGTRAGFELLHGLSIAIKQPARTPSNLKVVAGILENEVRKYNLKLPLASSEEQILKPSVFSRPLEPCRVRDVLLNFMLLTRNSREKSPHEEIAGPLWRLIAPNLCRFFQRPQKELPPKAFKIVQKDPLAPSWRVALPESDIFIQAAIEDRSSFLFSNQFLEKMGFESKFVADATRGDLIVYREKVEGCPFAVHFARVVGLSKKERIIALSWFNGALLKHDVNGFPLLHNTHVTIFRKEGEDYLGDQSLRMAN